MSTTEKLNLMKEIEGRNETRRQEYLRTCGARDAIDVTARAIIESLDLLARNYNVPRSELLELLVNTCWTWEQIKAQEG